MHVLQYIITTVLCYSAIYGSSERMSEKNVVIWRWEREADNLEKHFSSSLFDWDSTLYFFFWLRKRVARIRLKSVLYLLKHLFWIFKCFDMRQLFNCRKAENHFSSPEQSFWNYGSHPSKEVWPFCYNVERYIWCVSPLECIPLMLLTYFSCVSLTLWITQWCFSNSNGGQGEQPLLIFLLATLLE